MEQTNNIVGNFRIAIGGVVITFNIMDNPETIAQDLAKANAICDNVLSHLHAPINIGNVVPMPEKKAAKPAADVVPNAPMSPHDAAHAAMTLPATAQPVAQIVRTVTMEAEITPTADVPTTVEAEPVYTLADLRKSLSEIIDLGHRPAAEQYVQFHCKTKRTSEIAPEKYPAIIKDLAALADGLRGKKFSGYDDFAKAMGYELSTGEQE